MMTPMKITVLAGGLSHERDVSLSSGSLVAGALVRRGHEVCLVDLYTGRGLHGETPAFTRTPIEPYCVPTLEPDLDRLKTTSGRGELRLGPGVAALCYAADAVFIALHGDVGEDGRLQAYLDMEGIRYTGSGYAGSLLAMDKNLTKQILHEADVPTAPWIQCDLRHGAEAAADRIEATIGYPMVIKPPMGGSSVGVSMPEDRASLVSAIKKAAVYDPVVMAEKRIMGREVTVSVLGDIILPAIEIIPVSGFYDYENKYQAGKTREICPALLSRTEEAALREMTAKGFEALHLSGYARFDFVLDEAGIPWCLEANALPGMTPTSLLPQAAAAVGICYEDLCEQMIKLALK